MEDLFDPATHRQLRDRVLSLTPDSTPLWGSMSVTQMMTHCAGALRMVNGELRVPGVFPARLFGKAIKRLVLRPGKPMMRNAPTAKEFVIPEGGDFAAEREQLLATLDRIVASSRDCCTEFPHPFFGTLRPQEWSVLAYKHLDHHLRQFQA